MKIKEQPSERGKQMHRPKKKKGTTPIVSRHGDVNHRNLYILLTAIENDMKLGRSDMRQARRRLQGVLRVITNLGTDDHSKKWRRIELVAKHLNEHPWILVGGFAEERHEAALRLCHKFMEISFQDRIRVTIGIAKELTEHEEDEEFSEAKHGIDARSMLSRMIDGSFLSVNPKRFLRQDETETGNYLH